MQTGYFAYSVKYRAQIRRRRVDISVWRMGLMFALKKSVFLSVLAQDIH